MGMPLYLNCGLTEAYELLVAKVNPDPDVQTDSAGVPYAWYAENGLVPITDGSGQSRPGLRWVAELAGVFVGDEADGVGRLRDLGQHAERNHQYSLNQNENYSLVIVGGNGFGSVDAPRG